MMSMLYRSSWRFLLGLLLLTIIYGNVKSNELNKFGNARKNIFEDIKSFFQRIFKPPSRTRTTSQVKKNVTFEQNPTSPGITLKYNPESQPAGVKRRIPDTYMKNKKYGFQSDLNRKNQYRTFDNTKEDNYVGNKRRQNRKTLIIIVTKQEKVLEELIAREGLSNLGLSELFTRDDLNQTILRQAYGDACIKVAIRKCYKALRLVNNMVCGTRFKCKSSFKSTFLLKAKTGCITGFDYTQIFSQKKETYQEEEDIPNKKMQYKLVPDRALADEKRQKYIDACIPYMLSERSNTAREEIHLDNNLSKIITQILRSESDRKCQKFSREACIIACHFARDEVCSTFTCGRKKKNAFTKECKNECKRSYSIRSGSSDSSKSNSDSDNDSD